MTPQQQLAQRIAERSAMQAMIQTQNTALAAQARALSNEAASNLSSSPGMTSAARALEISKRDNYSRLEQEFLGGGVSNRDALRIAPGSQSYNFATALPSRAGFVPYTPQNVSAYNTQLDGWWNSYFQQRSSMTSLDAQIAELTAQLATANNQPGAGGTGTPGSPPPGGTPPQEVMQEPAATRDRARRDIARVAFGSPRFGVGLNIPLGT
jgi:hypothetical protein